MEGVYPYIRIGFKILPVLGCNILYEFSSYTTEKVFHFGKYVKQWKIKEASL